jgi:hypothetical protein
MNIHFNTTAVQMGGYGILIAVVSVIMAVVFYGKSSEHKNLRLFQDYMFHFWVCMILAGATLLVISLGGQIMLWITGGK